MRACRYVNCWWMLMVYGNDVLCMCACACMGLCYALKVAEMICDLVPTSRGIFKIWHIQNLYSHSPSSTSTAMGCGSSKGGSNGDSNDVPKLNADGIKVAAKGYVPLVLVKHIRPLLLLLRLLILLLVYYICLPPRAGIGQKRSSIFATSASGPPAR